MASDMAQAPEKTGMKLVEAHVPGLYSLKSIVYIVVCLLGPLVLAHLINLMGWWVPLVSTAAWNTLAFYLMSGMPRNAEKIRERYRTKYGDGAYRQFFYRYVVPVFAPCTIGFLMIPAVENSRFLPALSHDNDVYGEIDQNQDQDDDKENDVPCNSIVLSFLCDASCFIPSVFIILVII